MVVLDVVSRLRGFAFEEEFSPPEFFRDQLYLAFYFFFPVHQPLGGVEKKTLVGALSALISPLEATRNTLVLTAHHLSFSVGGINFLIEFFQSDKRGKWAGQWHEIGLMCHLFIHWTSLMF